MARLQRFPIIYSSTLGISGRRGTLLDTVYFEVRNIESLTIVCLKVVADLVGCDLPLVMRNAFEFVFAVVLRRWSFRKLLLLDPRVLGVNSSDDYEQAVSPVFCREVGFDLALDGVAKIAYC